MRTTVHWDVKPGRHTSPFAEDKSRAPNTRARSTRGHASDERRHRPKKAALAMAYKLLDAAQERWRRFNGHERVTDVLNGVTFTGGTNITNDATTTTDERVAA